MLVDAGGRPDAEEREAKRLEKKDGISKDRD